MGAHAYDRLCWHYHLIWHCRMYCSRYTQTMVQENATTARTRCHANVGHHQVTFACAACTKEGEFLPAGVGWTEEERYIHLMKVTSERSLHYTLTRTHPTDHGAIIDGADQSTQVWPHVAERTSRTGAGSLRLPSATSNEDFKC